MLDPHPWSGKQEHRQATGLHHSSPHIHQVTINPKFGHQSKLFDFRVPDVSAASIKGLQGLNFVDKTVEGTPTLDEAREEVAWFCLKLIMFILLTC